MNVVHEQSRTDRTELNAAQWLVDFRSRVQSMVDSAPESEATKRQQRISVRINSCQWRAHFIKTKEYEPFPPACGACLCDVGVCIGPLLSTEESRAIRDRVKAVCQPRRAVAPDEFRRRFAGSDSTSEVK